MASTHVKFLEVFPLHEPHQFTNQAWRPNRKRRNTAALQDAFALATVVGPSARFWSAPPRRRFRFLRQVHGLNSRQDFGGVPSLHEPCGCRCETAADVDHTKSVAASLRQLPPLLRAHESWAHLRAHPP